MPLELVSIATDTFPLDGLRWSMIHTGRALNPPEDASELRSRTNPPPRAQLGHICMTGRG
jgi:hypothetical protein